MALESISIRKMENQTPDFYEAVVVMSKRAKQMLNNRIMDQMMVSNEEVEMGVYDQIFEKNPEDYEEGDTFYVKVSEELLHIAGAAHSSDSETLKKLTSNQILLKMNVT